MIGSAPMLIPPIASKCTSRTRGGSAADQRGALALQRDVQFVARQRAAELERQQHESSYVQKPWSRWLHEVPRRGVTLSDVPEALKSLSGKRIVAPADEPAEWLIDGVEWLRLMYMYPVGFPEELMEIIADEPKAGVGLPEVKIGLLPGGGGTRCRLGAVGDPVAVGRDGGEDHN